MNIEKFLGDRQVAFDLIPHFETHDAQRMAATLHVPGREVAKTVLLRLVGSSSPPASMMAFLKTNCTVCGLPIVL